MAVNDRSDPDKNLLVSRQERRVDAKTGRRSRNLRGRIRQPPHHGTMRVQFHLSGTINNR
jgi:hypothetical protein